MQVETVACEDEGSVVRVEWVVDEAIVSLL